MRPVFSRGVGAGGATELPPETGADMLRRAMETIGVERYVCVGDSEVDVLTAQNAGVPCLSVLWGFRDWDVLEIAGARHFFSETAELKDKIEELMNGK